MRTFTAIFASFNRTNRANWIAVADSLDPALTFGIDGLPSKLHRVRSAVLVLLFFDRVYSPRAGSSAGCVATIIS